MASVLCSGVGQKEGGGHTYSVYLFYSTVYLNIYPFSFVCSSLQFLPIAIHSVILNLLPFYCVQMRRKKDAREFLHRAKGKDSEQHTERINNSSVNKKSQDKMLR